MSDHTKALVRRGIEEIWNGADFAVAADLLADDFVVHGPTPSADVVGRDSAIQFYAALHTAFPDIHFTIEDQVAEGDRVVTRWTARGTHTGVFQGMPPTGKPVQLAGIDINRIVEGKLVECWPSTDDAGLMRQLGGLPSAEPAGQ